MPSSQRVYTTPQQKAHQYLHARCSRIPPSDTSRIGVECKPFFALAFIPKTAFVTFIVHLLFLLVVDPREQI
jgi:hypothetical protein